MFEAEKIDIEQIESYSKDGGGLYVWFYSPKDLEHEKLKKIKLLFDSLELSLRAKFKNFRFKDNIEGGLKRRPVNENSFYNDYDFKFIKTFISNHSIPLYIGRTKSFKIRLQQHLESYHKEINFKTYLDMGGMSEEVKEEDGDLQDSEVESTVFGKRLAKCNEGNWIKYEELFIILYKFEHDYIDSMKNCEYFLNRLYRPILGNI